MGNPRELMSPLTPEDPFWTLPRALVTLVVGGLSALVLLLILWAAPAKSCCCDKGVDLRPPSGP